MNRLNLLRPLLRAGIGLAMVAGTIGAIASVGLAKDADSKPAKKKLTGEQLFAINCNRCHSERYPTERTKAQWKTLMMHMRVRANLPPEQAKAILKYLQENN